MKKLFKKLKQMIIPAIMVIIASSKVIYADGIQYLKIYSGTLALVRDATTALMVIVPVVCGLCILFFQFRKSIADQQEQQIWSKRTKVAIVSCIVGLGASGIVSLITSYYSG